MQAWFGRSRHPDAGHPYFLYAASNLGSFAALIAYPPLVEPNLPLGAQSLLWSGGFVLLAALVALCGLSVQRDGMTQAPIATLVTVTWAQRLRWTTLALVASGLLLSTTTHLTTDIAAMPLLWVIPVGAYPFSFVVAFGASGPRWTRLAQGITPAALLVLGVWVCLRAGPEVATIFAVAGILLLFVIALALHGTLAMEKPDAGALTDFYLWISVGGALGGVLCALIAPALFDWPYEHPLLLIGAAALVPAPVSGGRLAGLWQGWRARLALIGFATLTGIGAGWALSEAETSLIPPLMMTTALSAVMVLGLAGLAVSGRRSLFAYVFAMLVLAIGGVAQLRMSAADGLRERSFFGVYTVYNEPRMSRRLLNHGTTLHGLQSLDPALSRRRPIMPRKAASGWRWRRCPNCSAHSLALRSSASVPERWPVIRAPANRGRPMRSIRSSWPLPSGNSAISPSAGPICRSSSATPG